MGLFLQSVARDRDTDYQYSITHTRDYEVLDTLNSNDYTKKESESQIADHTYEYSSYYFTVPVGIEYRFSKNKKWCLRFGSIFSYQRSEVNDAIQIKGANAHQVITKYGDGREEVEIDDNTYESTTSHRKIAESRTTFFYGLGYNPTDYLQIDLLSFLGTGSDLKILDAEFFRSLRLSFSLKL